MTVCECLCHRTLDGTVLRHTKPDVANPIETLASCRECAWQHVPPPPPMPLSTADGWTDDPTIDTD